MTGTGGQCKANVLRSHTLGFALRMPAQAWSGFLKTLKASKVHFPRQPYGRLTRGGLGVSSGAHGGGSEPSCQPPNLPHAHRRAFLESEKATHQTFGNCGSDGGNTTCHLSPLQRRNHPQYGGRSSQVPRQRPSRKRYISISRFATLKDGPFHSIHHSFLKSHLFIFPLLAFS